MSDYQKELITKVTEGSGFGKIIISIFSNKLYN
jgi:hypothetical protein